MRILSLEFKTRQGPEFKSNLAEYANFLISKNSCFLVWPPIIIHLFRIDPAHQNREMKKISDLTIELRLFHVKPKRTHPNYRQDMKTPY